MTLTLHGIRNCDTVRKARAWLDERGVAYRFHDYKTDGVDEDSLRRWIAALGWERLLNRQGTTFRRLAEADRAGLEVEGAIALMLAQPSIIRRPILEAGGTVLAGFEPDAYAAALGHQGD